MDFYDLFWGHSKPGSFSQKWGLWDNYETKRCKGRDWWWQHCPRARPRGSSWSGAPADGVTVRISWFWTSAPFYRGCRNVPQRHLASRIGITWEQRSNILSLEKKFLMKVIENLIILYYINFLCSFFLILWKISNSCCFR